MAFENKQGLQLGPLETIVNVGWPGGYFIVFDVRGEYTITTPGTRAVSMTLSDLAIEAGAEIVAAATIHEPLTMSHKARTRFIGVVKFKKVTPGLAENSVSLVLTGAEHHFDTGIGSPPITLFCGLSSSSQTIAYRLVALPFNEGNFELRATITDNISTPGGSDTLSYEYVVAGIGLEEARRKDGTSVSFSGSSSTMWYIDDTGNYHNTQLSCDTVVVGTPTQDSTFEGFNLIRATLYPSKGWKAGEPAGWTYDTVIEGDILVLSKPDDISPTDKTWEAEIGQLSRGIGGPDFVEIFEDIPNGQFDWRFTKMKYANIPVEDGKPVFVGPSVFPTSPAIADLKYKFKVANLKPSYLMYVTDPVLTNVKVGAPPPYVQSFNPE